MYEDKEAAEKCIEIAEKSMQSGNKEKALRFLEKAERFCPTDYAKGKLIFAIIQNGINDLTMTPYSNIQIIHASWRL